MSKQKRTGARALVDVAPAIPLPATSPQTYTYHLSPTSAKELGLYTRVKVPFGKRFISGIVVRHHQGRVPYATKEAVPEAAVSLSARQVALAEWIARTMRGGLGYTLRLFYPGGKTAAAGRGPTSAQATVGKPAAAVAPEALIEADEKKRMIELARIVQDVIKKNRQALIIVPERWMVSSRLEAFAALSPTSRCAAVDASLRPKAYATVWSEAQHGKVDVVVGTQKALFLPYIDLGLVVIEEEFYSTHKLWDQYPRLDNRRAAAQLAAIHRAPLLYATSFPSLALYHQMETGAVRIVRNAALVPRFSLVTRDEKDRAGLFPRELLTQLTTWLRHGERIVILHNARGAWRGVVCRACGQALRCPECQIALTVRDAKGKQLVCRHDGYTQPFPDTCPSCHRRTLIPIGAGSEKVYDTLRQLFPSTPIARLDADTLKADVRQREEAGQIIVGTSALFTMFAGKRVDRVVYFYPEQGLLYPDFRSAERTLMLAVRLQQLLPARRKLLLVTRRPASITPLLKPMTALYTEWLRERKRLAYPPFTDLVLLTVQASRAETVTSRAAQVRELLDERLAKDADIAVRGPFAGFIKQRRGQYEQHILLTGKLEKLREVYQSLPVDVVDVDPERIL